MRKALIVENAAKPIGPYSHAVVANGFVFISGQGTTDPKTGQVSPDFREQAVQVFENVKTILEGVAVDLKDVVKVNCYLTDMSNFKVFNEVYRTFFPADFPVRTTVSCALPGEGHLAEVDCIAALPDNWKGA